MSGHVWHPNVARWVAARLGFTTGFGECAALGFLDVENRLISGAIFHNYNPDAGVIEISGASVRPWATPARVRLIFTYAFEDAGCQMAVARISENNPRARGFWRKLGADEFIIPRLRGRDEAECLYTLTVEQWQEWLNGKTPRPGAA